MTSLRQRLLALWLASLAGLWLASAGLVWWGVHHELGELLDDHLQETAAVLVAQATPREPAAAPPPAGEAEDDDTRVIYQVLQGEQVVQRSPQPVTATPLLPADSRSGLHQLTRGGETWRVWVAHDAARGLTAVVGEATASRAHVLEAVWHGMWWPLALAVPVLALLGWWLVARALHPLHTLSQRVAEREPAALRPVALEGAPSEVAPLVAALNSLFARVDATLAAERRFTADAAHELRTPIAGIRAQAQAALAQPEGAAQRQALAGVLEGCDRAARLVAQLLALARLDAAANADAPKPAPPPQTADLCAVARQTLADLAPDALARRQILSLEAEGCAPVASDAALLGMLVRNLVDNALRYSPAGARIEVAVQRQPGGAARLTVADSGPGMTAADRARLGERFFRALGHEASGSGLGWSIIQRMAQAQGWAVAVDAAPGLGGLRVQVTLGAAAGLTASA